MVASSSSVFVEKLEHKLESAFGLVTVHEVRSNSKQRLLSQVCLSAGRKDQVSFSPLFIDLLPGSLF